MSHQPFSIMYRVQFSPTLSKLFVNCPNKYQKRRKGLWGFQSSTKPNDRIQAQAQYKAFKTLGREALLQLRGERRWSCASRWSDTRTTLSTSRASPRPMMPSSFTTSSTAPWTSLTSEVPLLFPFPLIFSIRKRPLILSLPLVWSPFLWLSLVS